MSDKSYDNLPLENRVEISKNQVEIEHNKHKTEGNREALDKVTRDFSRIKNLLVLLLSLSAALFLFIFINGYLVYTQNL